MSPHERQEKIIDLLLKKGNCTIEDLMLLFPKISESTIRRDLKLLESGNQVLLFHGGDIQLKRNSYELVFLSKKRNTIRLKYVLLSMPLNSLKMEM